MNRRSALTSTLAAVALCAGTAVSSVAGAAGAAEQSTTVSGASTAAAERPSLEVPFPCGQEWRGNTRKNHDPLNAIDFNLPTGGDSDLGKPVQASNGGVVTFAGTGPGGYGKMVDVYHANGWSTRYAHLSVISVAKGQKILATNGIGRVGKSGGQSSAHLHYEQRYNDSAAGIYFKTTKAKYWGDALYKRTTMCS
ncbi:hypothetical protein QE370_001012 [Aeromicrobium sp. SORGH_AS981]|uniref:M23 family metallopeptidase n=1 Tax=Aeromicrobium sp. SORGH_AS_0981 TaxID=3041802 RepID=UPI0028647CB8|nr:M23 family metallopeptidase [Aeromicrobium sp. SORGH_AS_0981]MDR6117828.1 hypothetical protein [Aeromicrobium sp. SORGH_AS_0981]